MGVAASPESARGQNVPQFDLFAAIELPDDVRRKILRDNARRVLQLRAM